VYLIYLHANHRCWIRNDDTEARIQRIVLFFGPVWLMLVAMTIMFGQVVKALQHWASLLEEGSDYSRHQRLAHEQAQAQESEQAAGEDGYAAGNEQANAAYDGSKQAASPVKHLADNLGWYPIIFIVGMKRAVNLLLGVRVSKRPAESRRHALCPLALPFAPDIVLQL